MSDCMDVGTLRHDERLYLQRRAAEAFPAHRFELRANQDGHGWVVLEPTSERAGLLRFTICRITPSVMVLIEDSDDRRQICSAASVEDAMVFVSNAADQAVLAAMNAHPAHPVPQ